MRLSKTRRAELEELNKVTLRKNQLYREQQAKEKEREDTLLKKYSLLGLERGVARRIAANPLLQARVDSAIDIQVQQERAAKLPKYEPDWSDWRPIDKSDGRFFIAFQGLRMINPVIVVCGKYNCDIESSYYKNVSEELQGKMMLVVIEIHMPPGQLNEDQIENLLKDESSIMRFWHTIPYEANSRGTDEMPLYLYLGGSHFEGALLHDNGFRAMYGSLLENIVNVMRGHQTSIIGLSKQEETQECKDTEENSNSVHAPVATSEEENRQTEDLPTEPPPTKKGRGRKKSVTENS